MNIPEITVSELKTMMDEGRAPILLDVRRPDEVAIASLGGMLIPLQELPERLDEMAAHKDEEFVVYCRSGARSGQAVAFLQSMGYTRAKNLKGGILAWSREIDPSMPAY